MRKLLFVISIPLFLGAGCVNSGPSSIAPIEPNPFMREKVTFKTEDGVEIVGDYLSAGAGSPPVLLLHMMPATRASWHPFMDKLREAGFSSLAIDWRGHGESVKKFQISPLDKAGGRDFRFQNTDKYEFLDYKKFSDKEQQAKILDIRAAVEWLEKNKGAREDSLLVVGASIGANLALQYLAENPGIKKAVLLSPGLDYRGVKTDVLVKRLNSGQKVLVAASADDEYSLESVRELNRLNPAQTELREFSGLGHGTTMFLKKAELVDEVIEWLK